MSVGGIITVEKDRVVIALRRLQLSVQEREGLKTAIGARMLTSIERTFQEQGSPGGSWVPLAASTIKRNPKKYGPAHKLLQDKKYLKGSINASNTPSGVVIGTSVIYARVQNNGSKDRTGGPFGPQARLADRAIRIKAHFRTIRLAPRYERVEVTRADGSKVRVPRRVFQETVEITNKRGRKQIVTRLIDDPGATHTGAVGSHSRHQNIPARPFMVFRPEDPGVIRSLVVHFVNKAKADAGLAGA